MFYLTTHSTHPTYTRKEGYVLFYDALNTFQHILLTLGRKEMFYLTTHSTHPTYTRKEGDVLFNNALNTFQHILLTLGRKEMFYLTTHSTHPTYTRKEGDVLFNNALNTFQHILLTLGRKEMFYFTTHSTHFNTFYLHLEGRRCLFNNTLNTSYLHSEGRRCFISHSTQHISTHRTYTRKEGDVLFYDALNTFQHILLTLGRKEMFYLTTHSTHFNTFYLHSEGRRCFI